MLHVSVLGSALALLESGERGRGFGLEVLGL